jgi:neutral ceramidase
MKVGCHKQDITTFKKDCGMLGYGRHYHYMKGVETAQYARAFAFESDNKRMAYVVVDYCFTTIYLKEGIIQRLNELAPELSLRDENLMICAQHTHSAAGGYTQHIIYNMTTPGFQEDIYHSYREGIAQSILSAFSKLVDAQIFLSSGTIDKDAEVAFNRSVDAYNQNPEIREKIKFKARNLAVDRKMTLVSFQDMQGNDLGSLNWFGVHTTSVSNRRDKVCYDNKGYAADQLDDWMQKNSPHKVCNGFAQEASADVSPNFIWMPKLREYRGKFKDDYESAAYNGEIQSNKAKEILDGIAIHGLALGNELDYIQAYFDMTKVDIPTEYTSGLKFQKTGPACFGISFLEGTTDGQGAPKLFGALVRAVFNSGRGIEVLAARLGNNPEWKEEVLNFYNAQRPKTVVMNLSRGIVAGAKKPEKLIIPGFLDPIVKYIKYVNKVGKGIRTPWVEETLPLQIIRLGQLAIVGIPSEISTIAGDRIRKTLAPVLKQIGIEHIIISPYANAYAGYITTPEEYKLQKYEGGHTLFGRWTLAAYQKNFKSLALELLKEPKERKYIGTQKLIFSKEEIWTGFDDPKVRVY